MPSLDDDFNELLERLRQGREFEHASFEPVYYLVFAPSQILQVKRKLTPWRSRLQQDGWEVTSFSIADAITNILQAVPQRKIWLAADRKAPQDWQKTNPSLANAIANGALQTQLREHLEGLRDNSRAMLLVTDLEALHPYLRIGTIEGNLAGAFHVPTVFLYPGTRTGKTRLKFLGFYPEDGNYRSEHVGG